MWSLAQACSVPWRNAIVPRAPIGPQAQRKRCGPVRVASGPAGRHTARIIAQCAARVVLRGRVEQQLARHTVLRVLDRQLPIAELEAARCSEQAEEGALLIHDGVG